MDILDVDTVKWSMYNDLARPFVMGSFSRNACAW